MRKSENKAFGNGTQKNAMLTLIQVTEMKSIRIFLQTALFLGVSAICSSAMPPFSQDAVLVQGRFGPTGKIPQGFQSYSLFLICNPTWLGQGKADSLEALYDEFTKFGTAIGHQNAAIWFWKGDSPDSRFAGNGQHVDIERSKHFCHEWHLQPGNGPYIVITTTYPDEDNLSSQLPKNNAVFALSKMDSNQIGKLLGGLSLDLNNQNGPAQSSAPAMWVSLLTAVQQTINSFGCAWTFKIDAGPVKADLHSCHQGG